MAAASCFLRRVSAKQIDALIADSSGLHAVLFPSTSETAIDDDVFIQLDAEWAPLDQLLTSRDPSLTFLHGGCHPLGDVSGQPARGCTAEQVRRIATQISLIGDIPPALGEPFTALKDFVTETARAEAGMIIFWR